MKNIVRTALAILVGFLLCPALSAGPDYGTICLVPNPPGCCRFTVDIPFFDFATLMVRMDAGKKIPWPRKTGLKIENLSLTENHLVVIYSGGKPIQSFRFKFTDYKATELCLLVDGFPPELREFGKWCKCK
jgi:hypothetical protein